MILTDREIKIISSIPKDRRHRRLSLWLSAAAIFLAVLINFNVDYDLTITIAMLGGFLGGQAAAYSGSRSDDQLISLVQRYVNSDAEAIRQIAARAGEHAA